MNKAASIFLHTRSKVNEAFGSRNVVTMGKVIDYGSHFVISSNVKELNNRFLYPDAACGYVSHHGVIVGKIYKIGAFPNLHFIIGDKFLFGIKDIKNPKNERKVHLKHDFNVSRF